MSRQQKEEKKDTFYNLISGISILVTSANLLKALKAEVRNFTGTKHLLILHHTSFLSLTLRTTQNTVAGKPDIKAY